jgi:hypothetical protein
LLKKGGKRILLRLRDPSVFHLNFTKMDIYQTFYKNYFATSDEDARMLIMKDFMLSLPVDEMMAWIKDGINDMVEAQRIYSPIQDEDNVGV